MKRHWIPFYIAAAMNVSSFLWLALKIPAAPFPFIIQYHIFGSRDILGSRVWLFLLPFVGLVIFTINLLIFLELLPKHRFLANLTAGATVFVECLVFFGAWSMVYINT